MNIKLHKLLNENYNELFNNYCKYNDKKKLINSCSCEDIFGEKILYFLQLDIEEPTLDILKTFLKTKRKEIKYVKCIEYKDYHIEKNENESFEDKIQYLFVDYRKIK